MTGFRVLAATGMLGSGFLESSIRKAVEDGADMVGCDAGSTDAGPDALATGVPQFSRQAVKRDTDLILKYARQANVPMIIGSAGTAGGDQNLAWMLDIVHEVARERDLHFNLTSISAEQSRERISSLRDDGRTRPLGKAGPLTAKQLDESLHIVAMMGVEPIQAAIRGGADVVITGRSSDTAIFAALPLMHGCDPGLAWHAAKILECGAAAVTQRLAPDSMMAQIDEESFDIWPLREDYRCTPQSVASHSLYENTDPFLLREPSGTVDTSGSRYEAVSDRAVRVSGSQFRSASEYTVKLEGVRRAGYSTIVPGAVRDPIILRQLDAWLAQLGENIAARLGSIVAADVEYQIVTRVYGRDGVMGELEPMKRFEGHEAFIMWDVIAPTQALARSIASSLSHLAVHNPIPEWNGLISGVAFPFAPAEIDRGEVHEFHIEQIAILDDPLALFTPHDEKI